MTDDVIALARSVLYMHGVEAVARLLDAVERGEPHEALLREVRAVDDAWGREVDAAPVASASRTRRRRAWMALRTAVNTTTAIVGGDAEAAESVRFIAGYLLRTEAEDVVLAAEAALRGERRP